ncbi:MAG: hypothetical protein IJ444_01675 [Kiritimatiellae bacterium]|nr:hypothetical protein [Kiritimatiellia bacterium]
MNKYLKIAQINQENYISNSLAASRYPPEKPKYSASSPMLKSLGGLYTQALGCYLIASIDFAMTKEAMHPRTSSTWVTPTLALVSWPWNNGSKTMSNPSR